MRGSVPSRRLLGIVSIPRLALAVMTLMLVASSAATAQDIDYRGMEQLFGEPVTQSATGKPQRASDAPVNMVIITQDDIRRSGATSIPDVLQFVAGVDVRTYGVADAEVGIRGYNQPYNPRLLVLVNGRQVYSDDYGHVSWFTIPVQMEEIRQIEVIKGPNSALYGFNAVSGVINIITYSPLYDSINTATLRGGTQNYIGGSAVTTARVGDNAGLRLSLGGLQARDFVPGNLTASDAVARRSPLIGTFNIDGRARITPNVELVLEASMADGQLAEKDLDGVFDTSYSRNNSLRAELTADTPIGVLNLNAYRNEELVSINAAGLANLSASAKEDVYVVQASDLVKLGTNHTVRVGLEYRDNFATGGFFNGTIGYQVLAGSVMWDWRISPGVSVTNALRVDNLRLRYSGTPAAGSGLTPADYNDAGFTVASFNSGVVFQPTNQDTIRLMAARGVQAPSLVDFGLQIPAGTIGAAAISGNPDVHPTLVYNLELDYDREIPSIGSTSRASVFYQRNEDLISEPFSSPPVVGAMGIPLLLASNVGHGDAIGTELGVRGHSTTGLRWNLSYSFVVTTDATTLNSGPVPTSAASYSDSVPRHVVVAGIGYTRDRLELDLMARWQSSYLDFQLAGTALRPVEVPNYILLNGRIGYRLTDTLTVAATVRQFNTSRLMQTAGPPVERSAIVSVNAHF
jgi:iron complex outermembrane receptor protein